MTPALALLLLAATVSGEVDKRYGYEELSLVGWNTACSVGIRHMRFPPTARGTEPTWARIGIVSLDPAETRWKTRWSLESGAAGTLWDRWHAEAAVDGLRRIGYRQASFEEVVRAERVARQLGLEALVKSTASLGVPYPVAWPAPPYVMTRIDYSPLGNCAFVTYEKPTPPPDVYRYELVRVPLETRRQRAAAHLTNALLLYRKESDIYGALAEAATAASMDPRLAEARYHHAALLAAHGRFEEAIAELAESVRLDRKYAALAKQAPEFEDVRKQGRFLEALAPKPGTLPLKPR